MLPLATALVLGAGAAEAQEGAPPQWTPATLFPPGALLAVVSGDPARPGQTTAEPDVRKADTLRTGDTGFTPTGVHHYWVALGPTVVALAFDGPYTITHVNTYEAPRGTSFPYRH